MIQEVWVWDGESESKRERERERERKELKLVCLVPVGIKVTTNRDNLREAANSPTPGVGCSHIELSSFDPCVFVSGGGGGWNRESLHKSLTNKVDIYMAFPLSCVLFCVSRYTKVAQVQCQTPLHLFLVFSLYLIRSLQYLIGHD